MMSINLSRGYNCKNDELPMICKATLANAKRDLTDFAAYSPKFNEPFITGFGTKIGNLSQIIEPRGETALLAAINQGLYETMDSLIKPLNYLAGYLRMGNGTVKISTAQYGINDLRKAIKRRDSEAVIKMLHLVTTNNTRYAEVLKSHGLTDSLMEVFTNASDKLDKGKQQTMEIRSNRKAIVQNNIGLFNELNDQLTELLYVGKILYKGVDEAKTKDYTFSELKKLVRRTVQSATANVKPAVTATEEKN